MLGWHMSLHDRQASRMSGARALAAALLATTALTAVPSMALAQTYVWGGTGSTTTTSDYYTATNWSDPPGGAPIGADQHAIFASTGSSQITFGSTIYAATWTFAANAQSYTISGGTLYPINYSGSGGIYNYANEGQTIRLAFSLCGCYSPIELTQNGNSTLAIAGNFSFYGHTTILAGRLVVESGASLATYAYYSVHHGIENHAIFEARTGSTIETSGRFQNTGTATIEGSFSSNDIRNEGHLTFSGGAQATAYGYVFSGETPGSLNSLTVKGPGTVFTMGNDLALDLGAGSTGTFRVTDGARVASNNGGLAVGAGSTTNALVAGAGSVWQTYFQMYVGLGGTGNLTIADGGLARAYDFICCDPLGSGVTLIGVGAGATGNVLVTGAGSRLWADSRVTVGHEGTGTLTVRDGGDVTASNIRIATVAGSTGTLAIGGMSGGPAAAPGTVTANEVSFGDGTGTLVFNHTATDYTFSANIVSAGFGARSILVENGTTTLVGSILDPFGVIIDGGRLNVDGNGAGLSATVNTGGTFGGSGTVNHVIVNTGGTFASGNMAVLGDLAMSAGSTYSYTTNLMTTVSGTATLGGANLAFKAMSFSDQTYTVLTHGARVGTFTLAGDGAIGSVVYNPNDVQLTVQGYRAGTALADQGTVNTRNVGAAVDRVIDASGGAPPAQFNGLLGVTGASLANSFNQMSGEAGTGAVATGLTGASTFLGLMLDPMAGARGATADAPGSSLVEMADVASARTPAARVEAGWSIWTKAYGQAGRTASDAALGAAGTASSLYGVAAGADRLISPGLLVGFALAGGGTSFGLGTLGSGTGDFAQLGAYASMRLGPGYVSAALAYGWNRFDVTRNVLALGVTETYRSSPVGHTFGGRIETGRRFSLGNPGFGPLAVTPYAAAEAIAYLSPGYRESWTAPATGAFALAYQGRTTATLRGEIGARADAVVASAASGDLIAFSRLAYAVQSNTQRAAEAQFQQIAGAGFTVFGARASTHTALATLGVEARFRQGTRASLALDGELGDRHRALRGSVGLRQSW